MRARRNVPRPGGLSSSSVPSIAPDPVGEPAQPGAARGVGAAAPVVGHLDQQLLLPLRDPDAGVGRAGVLRHVGQALGDDEVGRGLDGRGKPAVEREAQLDRDGGARGEALQGRVEAPLGEHRGVDPGREVAQLVDGGAGLLDRPVEELAGGAGLRVPALARELEVDQERDEPLLGTVVQVAPEPPALGVPHRDDPRAGLAQGHDAAPAAPPPGGRSPSPGRRRPRRRA